MGMNWRQERLPLTYESKRDGHGTRQHVVQWETLTTSMAIDLEWPGMLDSIKVTEDKGSAQITIIKLLSLPVHVCTLT